MEEVRQARVVAESQGSAGVRRARVVRALQRSLLVELEEEPTTSAMLAEVDWPAVKLLSGERGIDIGLCRFFPHGNAPHRRAGDPPPQPGHGRLVPVDDVIDFRALLEKGLIVPLAQHAQQLPVIIRRKDAVSQRFRAYTSDLAYDLQVFRSLLDEIDRSLEHEPAGAATVIRNAAVASQWQPFCALFDGGLAELESIVTGLGKQENELHGFYFRKHMWDMILCSSFMARTNLKPRGYAGDSEMMRMIYEDDFFGPTVFSQFMHRHPIRTAAAQAVRNRRALLSDIITARAQHHHGESPLRVMSVACGPAREIGDIVQNPLLARSIAFTLLDQDAEALAQAKQQVDEVAGRIGVAVTARSIRDSVRTMLRTSNLRERWGGFDVIYSMGLFDYLVGPVARAVLSKLFALLESGGELIIGNFHVGNKTRVYMEYWMDWVLFYRDEQEMLSLAEDLPGARVTVELEDTKSQMFLRIKKD